MKNIRWEKIFLICGVVAIWIFHSVTSYIQADTFCDEIAMSISLGFSAMERCVILLAGVVYAIYLKKKVIEVNNNIAITEEQFREAIQKGVKGTFGKY
jgi:cell division protein FtsL